MITPRFLLATFVVFTSSLAQSLQAPRTMALASTSEEVLVGSITDAVYDNGNYDVSIGVRRVLKGTATPTRIIHASYVAQTAAERAGGVVREDGLFFLKNSGGRWSIVSANSDGLGLRAAYLPISGPGPTVPAKTVSDGVIRELAAAADANSDDPQYARRFLAKVSYADSPSVEVILREWANKPISPLHAAGLAGLIASGDSKAVQQFAVEFPVLSKLPDRRYIGTSLHAFRKDDPAAVVAIGKIATMAGDQETKNAAVWALSTIHSRESLPYLYHLLSSSDALSRQLAVQGFSAFVSNMRIAVDGSDSVEALDEVLNPGRAQMGRSRFDTADTRRYIHFGAFKTSEEEKLYLMFWSTWFQQTRGSL